MQQEVEWKSSEFTLRRMELENEREARQQTQEQNNNNNMIILMQNSMNQVQQFSASLIQNQQTQNQAFLAALEKLAKK